MRHQDLFSQNSIGKSNQLHYFHWVYSNQEVYVSSSITSKMLRERIPYPLAASLDQALRTTESAARVKYLLSTLDIFLRLTTAWLLSDYLRGQKNERIESELPKFNRNPSLGHYRSLIREISRHNLNRSDSFFPEISTWHFKKNGKPTDQAKLLDSLIEQRNKDGHGPSLSETEILEFSKQLEIQIQRLLSEAEWLRSYRIFRIPNASPIRGGYKGTLLFYCGRFPQPVIY